MPRPVLSVSTVDAVVRGLDPSLRPIASALRELVHRTAPELVETVKWGVPVWSGRKNVLCIMIYPDHLNLGFFEGARLAHRYPEVEGTGKSLRHVKVRSVSDARRSVLTRLIRDATELDQAGGISS